MTMTNENLEWSKKKKQRIFLNDGKSYGYDSLHVRLRNLHGKANKCEKCNIIGAKRYEWALIKGKNYSLNIKDYMQLCKSCHREYDFTEETSKRMSESQIGNSNSSKPILMIYKNIPMKIFKSLNDASDFTGIKRPAISNNLLRLSKTTKNGHRFEYF